MGPLLESMPMRTKVWNCHHAVILISPVHLTCDMAVRILELGYPLLMEKPPGTMKKETLRIIEAARKFKVPNRVAFNRRYTPLLTKLKHMVEVCPSTTGIQNIRYDLYRVNRKDPDFSTTAIHGIDAVRTLMGSDYSHIDFFYHEQKEIGPGVADIFMACQFESGAYGQLSFCPMSGFMMERCVLNMQGHTFFLNLPVWGGHDVPGRLQHYREDSLMQDISGLDILADVLKWLNVSAIVS